MATNAMGREYYTGHCKMKNSNRQKGSYKKSEHIDNILNHLRTKLNGRAAGGMRHTPRADAAQRYYAAFPALSRRDASPADCYRPPAWCRREEVPDDMVQSECAREPRVRRHSSGRERRAAAKRGARKRSNTYTRPDRELPEWVTYEAAAPWDMEAQDPVEEFIRALAPDEGYGTCENTAWEDAPRAAAAVPDCDDLDFRGDWARAGPLEPRALTPAEEELYARFEAKFKASNIEALWTDAAADTPDDECQELPIDFQDLLSSPSDDMFDARRGRVSTAQSLLAQDACEGVLRLAAGHRRQTVEVLVDSFRPLNLADCAVTRPAPAREPRAAPLPAALHHDAAASAFKPVPPRRAPAPRPAPDPVSAARHCALEDGEDLLVSARTHFRPIKVEARTAPEARYEDGATFDVSAEFVEAQYERGADGYLRLAGGSGDRYLEYRSRSIDYTRLNLTAAQRSDMGVDPKPPYRLKFAVRASERGTQTDAPAASWGCANCGPKKMRAENESIWSAAAGECACAGAAPRRADADDPAEFEELMAAVAAAVAPDAAGSAERKRRHSAALRPPQCAHPHAMFLQCGCDRPLTR